MYVVHLFDFPNLVILTDVNFPSSNSGTLYCISTMVWFSTCSTRKSKTPLIGLSLCSRAVSESSFHNHYDVTRSRRTQYQAVRRSSSSRSPSHQDDQRIKTGRNCNRDATLHMYDLDLQKWPAHALGNLLDCDGSHPMEDTDGTDKQEGRYWMIFRSS